ncbi:MAG TPA: efflux RND transporter periplasmic adaptor subunit [Candidatus Polarisedimenticolaceae bacterium]|nr:efflux RND transporter periplasmic adaptor subunit [Candidatus Polarisedimenticolaceae bacterium]
MTARKIALAAVLLGILVLAALAWNARGPAETAAPQKWTCPMHPQIVMDHPGSCPICGMDLVPVGKARAATHASGVPGQGVVHLDATRRQLIGVRTAPVELAPFTRTIRAVGRVSYDETRLRHVHTKIDGYVERLSPSTTTGESVRHGQPLLEIYSPELLASQQEFLVALEARDRMRGSDLSSVAGYGQDLVESARRRLQLFDMTDAQIARLEETRTPQRTVTVFAHESGVVTLRNVTEGERIEAGTTLLDVADLSKVWVLASVYEYELPFVHQGQSATMRLSYLPERTFQGKVSLVYPTIEAATRTAQVRVEFDNPDLALKPDMYAEIELTAQLGEKVSVPDEAVLETGTRSLAFVEVQPGVFEPREVRIGARLPDRYEVLSGLTPGEQVVVSGNFLIDSESKLEAAQGAGQPGDVATDPHAGHAR